ncbi:MAG: SLBB domain-containing protein [Candidatus Rokubacteria bacterium]|nr:SLBB domain-containing protein [Candidatus Rokubacteria bacterium]
MSALLAVTVLLPSLLGAPAAVAQTGPGGFGSPGMPGSFGGYSGGQDAWGGNATIPPQQYVVPPTPQINTTSPSEVRPTPSAPGLCTSQTYHTLTVNRSPDLIRTASAKPASEKDKDPAAAGKDAPRPDLDALSPIEASFQIATSPGQPLAQLVFEPARPRHTVAEPGPYVPVQTAAVPMPTGAPAQALAAPVDPGAVAAAKAAGTPQQQMAQQQMQHGTTPEIQTRFLGPFGSPLRQYGYAVFASYVSTFAPVDDVPVGPDYVVGPGDTLTVSMWGPLENTVIRKVDRNGQIMLPRVGDLRVWGLTYAQADRLIRDQLARYFRGFQTSVTMGKLRTLQVQIIGEVCQPGTYTLNSLASLTQALYAAGGPTKLGSLRNVRLLRNSHVVGEIDLYDLLLRGDRSRDFRLEAGDTIFIPTIGDTAAIAGEVKRPAIYEVRGDVRLADLVETAGGVTPSSYLKRVQIIRAQPSAERVTVDVDLSSYYLKGDMNSNPPVHSGDLVLVHKNEGRIYNTVKVDGAVKYPGVYELKPMMRLSTLLPMDRMLPESFSERVEIARRRPDYSVEVLSVNLAKAWTGDLEQDPLLKANDEVMVRTEMRATRTMTLSGQVMRPGVYTLGEGERLSSVLERAGGFTSRAYLKGAVFTRASLRRVEQEQLNAFVRVQEQRILAEASTTVVGGEREDAAIGAAVVQARRDFLRALASRVALGRMVIKVSEPDTLKSTSEDVVLADGDTLEVPEPVDSVLVLGSVRSSTSVLHAPGSNVDYYVNRVGGYAKEADKKDIHIVKADGSAVSGFSNIRTVEPGDTIIVPRSEDSKIRLLPTIRDGFQILGSTFSTVLSLAALAVLF